MVSRWFVKLPLRTVLIVPFVLQTVTAVGLVGYLSYHNGQKAVEDLAKQLISEVSARISDRLERQLKQTHHIIAANELAVKQRTLNLSNVEELRNHLWQQMILNPSIPSNGFVNNAGEFIGYGRISSTEEQEFSQKVTGEFIPIGFLYWVESRKPNLNQRQYYLVDGEGIPNKLIYKTPFGFRTLPWFYQSRFLEKQAWSSIYVIPFFPTLSIAAFTPIYQEQKFQGAFISNDLLAGYSHFLHNLNFSPSGQAFIIERSGNLVATSTLEKTYQSQENLLFKRLLAINSQDQKTRTIAQYLLTRFGNFYNIKSSQVFYLNQNGEQLWLS